MRKDLPSPELLHKLLRCGPETGTLFWRPRPATMFVDSMSRYGGSEASAATWNTRYAGTQTFGTSSINGYLTGSLFNRTYKTHRVIWAMVHGEWPIAEIDHINGVRDDNRIANLRSVSRSENMRNAAMRSNNTSGVMGVCRYNSRGKWHARVWVGGKRIHLGCFTDKQDAIVARKAAEIEYGYHENHGRAG